jgi:tRNA threonylcarbamoyladenosine biosynthesis protein TsaE
VTRATRLGERENVVRCTTRSERATEEIGAALGSLLRRGDLVALEGDLGAGKTCFVRGVVAGSGIDPRAVRSPTFVLHHVYGGAATTVHHIDCYRLGMDADLGFLDLDTLLDEGVVVIEWAGYADLRTYDPVRVTIDILGGDERVIRIEDPGGRFPLAVGERIPG